MRIAAIDIGTNSVHLVVADHSGDFAFEVVDTEKDMVKLGAGLFGGVERFDDATLALGIATVSRYVRLAERMNADEVLAVATSATREADNGEALVAAIEAETGVRPRVISGREEARLIYLAVNEALAASAGATVVIDIGGGSVELVSGEGAEILNLCESLPLGVLRLLSMVPGPGPLAAIDRARLVGYIGGRVAEVVAPMRATGFVRVVGTSGTNKALGYAAQVRAGGTPWTTLNGAEVPLAALCELRDALCEMTPSERASVDGIDAKRADAIHLGAVLLCEVMSALGAERLTLSEASLRDGVLIDYVAHSTAPDGAALGEDVRERAVRRMMRRYHVDTPHAEHVALLARTLFERMDSYHDRDPAEVELLVAAARLREIGAYVRYKRHHKTGRYLIRRSRWRGYQGGELRIIGQLVRYHRSGRPKKKHKRFRKLSADRRRCLEVLSALLRTAGALDRSRSALVTGLDVADQDGGGIVVRLYGRADLSIELRAARASADTLSRVLGTEVRFTYENEDDPR